LGLRPKHAIRVTGLPIELQQLAELSAPRDAGDSSLVRKLQTIQRSTFEGHLKTQAFQGILGLSPSEGLVRSHCTSLVDKDYRKAFEEGWHASCE